MPPVPPPNSFYAPYSEQENMYQASNPQDLVEQQIPYPSMQPRRNYNQYPTNYYANQKAEDYLPADVREDLLFKMLMLSIQPDLSVPMQSIPMHQSIPVSDASSIKIASTTTTAFPPEIIRSNTSKKPIRSVQILGEE